MTLKALIFDVDGTLAETEGVHLQAFNLAFADAVLDWYGSESLYRDLLKTTGGKERIKTYVRDHLGEDVKPWEPSIPKLQATRQSIMCKLSKAEV